VSFNNSEAPPAQEKSLISRGKWSGNKPLRSVELNSGYIRFFYDAIITHLHTLTAAGLQNILSFRSGGVIYFSGFMASPSESWDRLLEHRSSIKWIYVPMFYDVFGVSG
jgi:hypothetical protein